MMKLLSLPLFAILAGMLAWSAAPSVAEAQVGAIRKAIQKNIQVAVQRQQLRLRVERSAGPVEAFDISVDGSHMATVSGDRRPRLWDLRNGREVRRHDTLSGAVASVRFSPDGQQFVILEASGRLTAWSVARDGGPERRVSLPDGSLSLSLSPDGAFAAVGFRDGAIRLVDLSDGGIAAEFAATGESADRVELGSTGQFILGASRNGSVRIVEVSSGATVRTVRTGARELTDIAFGADETEFFTADAGGALVHWRVDRDEPVQRYSGAERAIVSLDYSFEAAAVAAVEQSQRLLVWDLDSPDKPMTVAAHPGGIRDVRFDSDPSRIVTTGEEGITSIWSRTDGSLIVSLISTENGWAAIDGDGRFDGSSRALSNMSWVGETLQLPVDNFTENLYEPDLLQKKRLGVGALLSPGVDQWHEGILPPPAVAVTAPGEIEQDELRPIEIELRVHDEGGGIGPVSLFHNTKLVAPDAEVSRKEREVDGKPVVDVTYRIRPIAGRNLFHANAASSEGILGNTTEAVVAVKAPPRRPVLHVLTVALNEYADPELNLNYAIPDARGIQEMMKGAGAGIFGEVRFHEVHNENATRDGFQQALRGLRDTYPEDVVVIYYAGHGEATENDFYFVTYRFELPISTARLERRALSASKLRPAIQEIGARRVILLIDACKSGSAVTGFEDHQDRRVLRQLGQSIGLHIVSATAKDQFAVEHDALGHGVFTYTLLEAMSGKADTDPPDGNLTVREVVHYTEEAVPRLSQEYANYQHWPLVYSRGLDFTISQAPATR